MKQDASYTSLDRIRQEQQLNPVFTIPGNYFESFPGRLMAAIKETDKAAADPVLDTVSRAMPYQVPPRYFAQFRVNRARVVEFKKGLRIAASFILLAVSSIFLFTKKSPTGAPAPTTSVATTVNQLTNEQMERFIQPEEVTNGDKTALTNRVKTSKTDMTTLFKNVPDADLATFLNETTEVNDEISLN
ncbi:hypothetical protein [Niabella hirudinis]|uniref:hypothetical protein n=1 Tax=Niabella hirudinis TaxID=1285929 RepID=UPI003EB7F04B